MYLIPRPFPVFPELSYRVALLPCTCRACRTTQPENQRNDSAFKFRLLKFHTIQLAF